MSHRHPLGLVLGATLLGIAAPAQDPATQDPPAEKHLLRYRLKTGTKGHFVMSQEMATKMDMGGRQTMNTDSSMKLFVEYEVGDEVVDGSCWPVQLKIYRVKMLVQDPMRGTIDYDSDDEGSDPGMLAQIQDLVGQGFRMKVDERGKVSDLQIPEKVENELEPVFGSETKGMFTQLVAVLPDEPVAIGETWKSTSSQTMRQMGKAKIAIENELVGIEGNSVILDQQMQIDLDALETPFVKMEVKEAKGTTVLDLTRPFPARSTVQMQMGMKTATEGMKMDVEMDVRVSIEPVTPATKEDEEEKSGASKGPDEPDKGAK